MKRVITLSFNYFFHDINVFVEIINTNHKEFVPYAYIENFLHSFCKENIFLMIMRNLLHNYNTEISVKALQKSSKEI